MKILRAFYNGNYLPNASVAFFTLPYLRKVAWFFHSPSILSFPSAFLPPVHEFFIGQLHIHHLIVFYPSQLDHHGSRDHIQYQFLCGTAFHSGAAGNKFGAHHHFYREISGSTDR